MAFPEGVVALTGTSGSGKSSVAKLFKSFGATIIDADKLAKEALLPGTEGEKRVIQTFGSAVVNSEDGSIDRRALGNLVFSDPAKKKILEDIVHPLVAAGVIREYEQAKAAGARRIIYDCPLFFEKDFDQLPYLASILVVAPEEEIISRLMTRDNRTREEIVKRLRNQLPVAEKMRRATFVLNNDGSVKDLGSKALNIYETLPL